MNRRSYLAALGVTALAGCSTTGESGTDAGTTTGDETTGGTPTGTATGTETASPTATETMTTAEQSLSQQAGADGGSLTVEGMAKLTDVRWDPERETAAGTGAVVGTLTNVSDGLLGRERNRLTLFDDEDNVVGTTAESVRLMRSGTTYEFVLPLVGGEPATVARFRLDAKAWSEPVEDVNDGQFAVDAESFGKLGEDAYGVSGTVTNETDEAYFQVMPHVNFYAGSELVGYDTAGVTDLGAGKSAEWQATFGGESPDAVDDAQVVVLYQK